MKDDSLTIREAADSVNGWLDNIPKGYSADLLIPEKVREAISVLLMEFEYRDYERKMP